ncbi:MAG: hypothetical protein O7C61_08490, partial [SAR324 cluster bacterium]|nr:hypothetical protein [SAR324 cluster bacterium]
MMDSPIASGRKSPLILSFLLSLAMLGCSAPTPSPSHARSAAIGIQIETRWLTGFHRTYYADKIYFIRLDGSADLKQQRDLIHSNFHKGDRVYLLNAKP